MRSLRHLLLLAILLTSTSAFGDENATLRFDASGSSESIPYYTGIELLPGIVHESVIKILLKAGITPDPITLPPKRTLLALQKGELDFHVMSLDWFPGGDYDSDNYIMSAPFLTVQEYIIAHPDTFNEGIPNTFTLHGKRVGTIAGYFYHDQGTFERVDFPSEQTLIRALELNRIPVAIIGTLPGLYWSQKLSTPVTWVQQHSMGELRLRIRKMHEDLLPAIDLAIIDLKSSGKFRAIERKYREAFDLQGFIQRPLNTEKTSK